MSTFPSSTIKDIAESVGIPNLKDDVATSLAQDVEYRIHEIVQEAMKFMRHGKRTKLTVDDINNALRVRNVEPLYGFSSADPTRFKRTTAGSTSTGQQELFFIEDEELDFETILSAPLPKVPLDVTYTAHWLAIEGVQPAIVQNPTPSDAKSDLFNKRIKLDQSSQPVTPGIKSGAQPSTATGAAEVQPLVKHVLSKELQMYYERITSAVLSQDEVLRATAISSLQNDPGLHQLLPYFVQLVAEKVTQNIRNMFVLEAMMAMVRAILDNNNLFVEPYLHQLMPTVLTCVVGKRLGESPQEDHWALRSTATDIILSICTKYGSSYHTLQPRVTRTLLRAFLDPEKPLTTHYGAILGLTRLGNEVFKTLVVPNLKTYSSLIEPELDDENDMDEDNLNDDVALRRNEARHCLDAILVGLRSLVKHETIKAKELTNIPTIEDVREPLSKAIGGLLSRSLLKESGIENHVAGIVAVIQSC
ncbi:hypothetical protein BG006_006321 [Podila minutissima]|uniref:TBP-associated factor 6 n=1 Tax=Podila minutissima TaxID=64525 RepID=A0A9P5SLD2_9FUNG|nr:hypothetical protein BG006_006321 [Podila minutissima]